MTQLGIAIKEKWHFFHEIYTYLKMHHAVSTFDPRTWEIPVFREKINQSLFRRNLYNFLKKNDVVFFEWSSELLVAATHLPKVCGIVTRLHRYEMYQWVDMINWDVVDSIIVVSQAKKREFMEKFPNQANKLVVIGPSTSLVKFSPQPKTFNGDIGILCKLTPRKRVYELILAFYELQKRRCDMHLHIGGEMHDAFKDYYHALRHIVKELNLQNSVTFYGNVTDTWDWFHKIDIFVSNSYSEGLQVAPMEAMASGCYCLAHHWDGADELLPEENLFYTNEEFKTKIERYCKMSESEKQLQKRKMRDIAQEKFNIDQTIKRINQVVTEVAIHAELMYGKKKP